MNDARKKGKIAAQLEPVSPESFKDLFIQQKQEHTKQEKQIAQLEIDLQEKRKTENSAEKQAKGNLSPGDIRSNLERTFFMGCLVLISFAGEYIFMNWTLEPFGLGTLQLPVLSLSLTILLLEGINLFLTAFRAKFPKADNFLFLVLGLLGLFLISGLTFYAAEIRGNLYKITAMSNGASSLERTVALAEAFFHNSSDHFLWLMVFLTGAITIIGGVCFHEARNRFFKFWSLWKLEREARRIERELIGLQRRLLSTDTVLMDFITSINTGYAMEKLYQAQVKTGHLASPLTRLAEKFKLVNSMGRIRSFPVILILCILAAVFLLKGLARGETIVAFDLSISSEIKSNFSKQSEFQQNKRALVSFIQKDLNSGEDLKCIGIHAKSYADPYIFFEEKITGKKGAFGEVLAREKLILLEKLKGLDLKANATSTDIFGAMHLAVALFTNGADKKLIIYSDMKHWDRDFDLETPEILQVDSLMKKALEKGHIPNLEGAKVWCLGVHSIGKTPAYWQSLREFWRQYFFRAHAKELKAFSMDRKVVNYE